MPTSPRLLSMMMFVVTLAPQPAAAFQGTAPVEPRRIPHRESPFVAGEAGTERGAAALRARKAEATAKSARGQHSSRDAPSALRRRGERGKPEQGSFTLKKADERLSGPPPEPPAKQPSAAKATDHVTLNWTEVEPSIRDLRATAQRRERTIAQHIVIVPLPGQPSNPFAPRIARTEAQAALRAVVQEALQATDSQPLTEERLRTLVESIPVERSKLELTSDKLAYEKAYVRNGTTAVLRIEIGWSDVLELLFNLADLAKQQCQAILARCADKARTDSGAAMALTWTQPPRPGDGRLLEAFHFPAACAQVLTTTLQQGSQSTIGCR